MLPVHGLLALQKATEMYMVDLCNNENLIAEHARRVVIMKSDMKLAIHIHRPEA